MAKQGGRTGWRVGLKIFANIVGKKGSNKSQLCAAVCDTYCFMVRRLRAELNKPQPDPTAIDQDISDFRTASDLREAGQCPCDCP